MNFLSLDWNYIYFKYYVGKDEPSLWKKDPYSKDSKSKKAQRQFTDTLWGQYSLDDII